MPLVNVRVLRVKVPRLLLGLFGHLRWEGIGGRSVWGFGRRIRPGSEEAKQASGNSDAIEHVRGSLQGMGSLAVLSSAR
jgi:hypothetical protein